MNPHKIQTAIIIIILLWLATILTYLSAKTAPTADEFTFVPSGYSYWKTGDFRMNTEHPPLIKLVSTAPLLFLDVKFPQEHPSWNKAQLFGEDGFYKEFVFHANKDKKETMLFITRIVNSMLAIILGLLILKWATELFGRWAGVLALGIYSIEPTILAHSGLFMTDMGLTLFVTLSLYTLWKFLKQPTLKNFIIAAIALGLTQLTKYTAIMLFIIYPAIMLTDLFFKQIKTPKKFRKRKLLFLTLSYVSMIVIAMLMINITYGFKGSFQTAQQMFDNDKNIDKTIYTPEKMFGNNKYLQFIAQKIPLPIPYHYIKGLGYAINEAKSERQVYLFGKTSSNGFWYYYVLSYLVKTPIPILVLLLISIIYFLTTNKKWNNELILIIPTIIYLILFSINQKQIGIRHILQIYPLLIIFTARITKIKWLSGKMGKIVITALLIFSAFELTIAFPDYISYANEIIGLNNGYKYFSYANIDLSQNIDKAAEFIKKNPSTKVMISTTDILNEYVNFQQLQRCEKGLVLTDAQTINTKEQYKWLKCKQPIQMLGRTILIYNITKC